MTTTALSTRQLGQVAVTSPHRKGLVMHELAECLLSTHDGSRGSGYVDRFVNGVMRIRCSETVNGLEDGQNIDVRVLDEIRGEVHYNATVLSTQAGTVEVFGLEQVSVRQRRGAARVRIDVRSRGYVTRLDSDEPKEIALTILDISATGARILVSEALPLDADVSFDFPANEAMVELTAKVVWSEESVSGWRHGCRFVGASPRDTEILFRYVLLTQGEQRRRSMENIAAG